MGSLYGIGYSGISGLSGYSGITGSTAPVIRSLSNFRLTLESGQPVSTSNQEAKTTLYMTPYVGKLISLYYSSTWSTYETGEISLSLSSYTANKNYDIWAYYSGSAVTLDSTVWTNDTTRATALSTQDAVYIKSGDATRRYIGTIRTTGTTGQCEDSYTSRYVWNMYNRVGRWGFTTNTTASWTYSSTTPREWNAGTGQIRYKFVVGQWQGLIAVLAGNMTGGGYLGLAFDQTTGLHSAYITDTNSRVYYGGAYFGTLYNFPPGYHYFTGVELINGGTMTVYGSGSTTNPTYGHNFLLEN
jgi:hypothetical protein